MQLMQRCRIDHHTFTAWHIICLTFGNCPIWIPSRKILQMQFLFLSVLPNVRGGGNQNHAWPLAAVRYFAKNRYDIRRVCWKLFWSFQRFAKHCRSRGIGVVGLGWKGGRREGGEDGGAWRWLGGEWEHPRAALLYHCGFTIDSRSDTNYLVVR